MVVVEPNLLIKSKNIGTNRDVLKTKIAKYKYEKNSYKMPQAHIRHVSELPNGELYLKRRIGGPKSDPPISRAFIYHRYGHIPTAPH